MSCAYNVIPTRRNASSKSAVSERAPATFVRRRESMERPLRSVRRWFVRSSVCQSCLDSCGWYIRPSERTNERTEALASGGGAGKRGGTGNTHLHAQIRWSRPTEDARLRLRLRLPLHLCDLPPPPEGRRRCCCHCQREKRRRSKKSLVAWLLGRKKFACVKKSRLYLLEEVGEVEVLCKVQITQTSFESSVGLRAFAAFRSRAYTDD